MGQKIALYSTTTGSIQAFYDSADSPPPSTLPSGTALLDITDSEWLDAISNQGKCTVVNGVWTVASVWPPAPTLAQQWVAYQGQCLAALNAIDTTMMRIVTAIALGKLSSTDATAQAWFTYQSDLRAQLSAPQPATIPTALPAKPTSYPAGT